MSDAVIERAPAIDPQARIAELTAALQKIHDMKPVPHGAGKAGVRNAKLLRDAREMAAKALRDIPHP